MEQVSQELPLPPHSSSKPAWKSQLEAAQPRSSHSAWVPALAGRAGSALELVRPGGWGGSLPFPGAPTERARGGRMGKGEAARATYLKKSFLQ